MIDFEHVIIGIFVGVLGYCIGSVRRRKVIHQVITVPASKFQPIVV
jgi:hypothetical protein